MKIEVVQADYQSAQHQTDIPMLLSKYAQDPMGGGKPLSQDVLDKLVQELSKRTFAFSVLAYVDDRPAGLINCFEGFSTFACKPLVNIHDVVVLSDYRGLGLSQRMLSTVVSIAKEKGCCKLTLEVLSNNIAAKSAYQKFGFTSYELDPAAGSAQFWEMKIDQ